MTREEAKEWLKHDRDLCNFNPTTGEEEPIDEDCRKSAEALDLAIKALDQEPCEDAVSRKAVLDIVRFEKKWLYDARSNNADTDIAFSGIIGTVKDLSPVTPTHKVGKWIKDCETPISINYHCSKCGRMIQVFFTNDKDNKKLECYPFCNCGAEMRGEEDEEN